MRHTVRIQHAHDSTTRTPTGQALATCTCGLNTGWVPAQQLGQAHIDQLRRRTASVAAPSRNRDNHSAPPPQLPA